MLGGNVIAFLIYAMIVLVVAYVVILVLDMIPSVPPPAVQIAKIIVGLIAFLLIIQRAAVAFGVAI